MLACPASDISTPPLAGTRVLISGAAGGIGAATARLCGAFGARLTLTDIAPPARLEAIAHGLPGVDAVERCDVSDRAAVDDLVRRHGPFQALADTAGICPYDEDWMDPDWNEVEFMRVMRVNVLGPINLVRAVMPAMMEHGYGRIALCGSIAGWTGGLRAGPHYAASKGGVHALVRWFAQRGMPHGVTVNGVAPGPVSSGMTEGHGYDAQAYPMKRMGQPEEIAGVLAFLCSPAASYLAGTMVDVNGGTYLR
ncbi:SDR family NAD(P)-dependent oxidoreductase [Bordetella sp. 15P40C-2]|uniref:SDR family NAD(P)-dependent oxidoreductase n=1 Tax=Bordetella sp. 15P40C-2 TaxID=2572246 RepID=UPI0013292415|nr:SDR family oxidoreductase [Bordetella sp. 15P40C-2]MVW70983.1 SDR family oxidoreductase [Bordetella sp. 15P40C-2]